MSGGEARDDETWTPIRRTTLAAAVEILWPLPGSPGVEPLLTCLAHPSWESREPLIFAVLDELDERSEGVGLAAVSPERKERLLRELEGDSNPYLAHGLVALLQLSLETRLGAPSRGGHPEGRSWTLLGLPAEGQDRCLAPPETGDGPKD